MGKRIRALLAILLSMAAVLPALPLPAWGVQASSAPTQDAIVVCIDPGHQAKGDSTKEPVGPGASEKKAKVTSGTRGTVTRVYEYELNLQIAVQLQKELERRGYRVVMVRTTNNVNLSNAQRSQMANRVRADAFLRIHANGSSKSSDNGCMTICQSPRNPYNAKYYKQSRALSDAVLNQLTASTGAKKERVWETDTMTGINWSQVPVTMVEMGYMTNPREDRLMATAAYQQKIVTGIANGVDVYFADQGRVQLPMPRLTGLSCTASGAKLTWSPVPGAAQYRVFRKKLPSGKWQKVGDTTALSMTDTGLENGTTYCYTVRCLSTDGKRYTSDFDHTGMCAAYNSQLAAPVITRVDGESGGVRVTWNRVPGAEQYRVFRKNASGGWSGLGETQSLSYLDRTALPGRTYTYTVRCVSGDGERYASSYDKRGVSLSYAGIPRLTGLSKVKGGVKLSWASAEGGTRYRVYRKCPGGNWTKLGETTETNWTDKTARPGQTYLFTVRCVTRDGKRFAGGYDSAGIRITLS